MSIVALAQAAFDYSVQTDLMSDAKTHVAKIGATRGPSLTVACGAVTGGEMLINFKPDVYLNDRKGGILLPFLNRVRFGQGAPIEMIVAYKDNTVVIEGRDAITFATSAKASDSVVFEFTDYRDNVRQMRIRLNGAPEAIALVEAGCSAKSP